jgi:hemerythrin-like domain-containing protein
MSRRHTATRPAADRESFMQRLRTDHAGLSRVLREIDRHQSLLRTDPEYAQPLLVEAMRYLLQYQHAFHHPREDRLFTRIRAHSPRLLRDMQRLIREHRIGQRRAEELAVELDRATPQQLRGRKGVQLARLLQSYVRHTRDHMRREEVVFYARSESVLERSDWLALAEADDPADPMSDLRRLAAEYPLLAARLTQPVREIGGTGTAMGTARSGDLMRHILEDFSEAYGGLLHEALDLVRANVDTLRSVRTATGLMRAARPIHARNMQFLGRCISEPTRWARQSAGAIVATWGRSTR